MKLSLRSLLIILIAWIFVVALLFMLIPDKKIASIIAGSGFVFIPLTTIVQELRKNQRNILVLSSASIFFCFSALPIFLLRILNWDRDFKDLSLFGVSSEILHKTSNVLYIFMLLAVGIALYRERKSAK